MNVKNALLLVLGLVVAMVMMYTVGVLITLAAVAGIVLALGILVWPLLGLFLLIFSGTCFQILGSSHITGLPLSLAKILGVLTLGSWILQVVRNRAPFTYSPQLIALVAFAGVVVVSAFTMPDNETSMIGLFKFVQVYLFFFLIANLAGETRRAILVTCMGLTAALTISGIIGAIEHFVPAMAIESDDPRLAEGMVGAIMDRESLDSVSIKRITGGLADANWLAYTLAAVLPLNVFWWRQFPTFWPRVIVLAAASIQLLGLVLTYTRTGFLGFGVAVLFLMYMRRLPLAPVAALGVVALLVALAWQPPGFMERMFSVEYLQEGSTPMRADLFSAAIHMAKDRPIFGYGYGQFGYEFIERLTTDMTMRVGAWGADLARAVETGQEQVYNIGAHSLYLEVMIEYGLLGLVPFLLFMWYVLKDFKVAYRYGDDMYRDLAVCLAAGAIAFYTCGLLGHAKTLKILWILAGLAAALRRLALVGDTAASPVSDFAPRTAAQRALRMEGDDPRQTGRHPAGQG